MQPELWPDQINGESNLRETRLTHLKLKTQSFKISVGDIRGFCSAFHRFILCVNCIHSWTSCTYDHTCSSHLLFDNCNMFCKGLPFRKHKLAQNAIVCRVWGNSWLAPVTLVSSLFSVQFKVLIIIFKVMYCMWPDHLRDYFSLRTSSQHTRLDG